MIDSAILYQEIEHKNVSQNSKMGDKTLPKNERQTRELLALDSLSEQVHVWHKIAVSPAKNEGR